MALRLKNGTELGSENPCWVVAEIGLCHNGDFELAKKMIKASVDAGADAVKFQKRDVDNLAINSVLDAKDGRFPAFGKTYRQIRRYIEFEPAQYADLKAYAESLGTTFFVSVFDITSANQMAELNMPVLKIASHCLSHLPLIEHLCDLKIPVLLSTGMATWEEIDATVERLQKADVPLALYHCVSAYPHSHELANLRLIPKMIHRYHCPVGYSSHELDNYSAFLATAMGACSIEKHVTFDRHSEGFDHGIAQDMEGFADLVVGVRKAEAAMGTGIKAVSDEEMITRKKYHSSVVSRCSIKAGEIIAKDMLTVKNPGTGIPAKEIYTVIGKRAKCDIGENVLVLKEMIGQ